MATLFLSTNEVKRSIEEHLNFSLISNVTRSLTTGVDAFVSTAFGFFSAACFGFSSGDGEDFFSVDGVVDGDDVRLLSMIWVFLSFSSKFDAIC